MVLRCRRELRSRTRVWLVYPVFAALLMSTIGGAYETYRERADAANFAMPGRLVDVGGHRLHINCTGTGSPTVVLEPGLGEPSTAMAWIAPAVAGTTRVYTRIASWPGFYEMFRRASGLLPALSRLGVGRVLYANAYSNLPRPARAQERAFLATPRDNRSLRDEFSQLRTAMAQARSLTSLGNVPLVVVTAEKDAEPGWMAAQTDLQGLSTQSVHRFAPDATHAMLTENQAVAARSSQAVRDVVNSIRTRTSISR